MKNAKQEIIELIRQKRPLVVVSHPRSGTHLTIDFLRNQFPGCGGWKLPLEANNYVYLSLDGIAEPQPLLDKRYAIKVLSRARIPIIKTHSISPQFDDVGFFGEANKFIPPEIAEALREFGRFLYVVRDCRKVMTSFHHWMSGFNDQVRAASFYEFLKQEPRPGANRMQQWQDHVCNWQGCPAMMLVRFEDLISKYQEVASQISSFTGIPFKANLQLPGKTSALGSRVNRLISWRPGSTAILGQNKGKPGNWDKLLTPDQSRNLLLGVAGTMDQFGYTL